MRVKQNETPTRTKARKTLFLGVFSYGEKFVVRKEIQGKMLTVGPFDSPKEAANYHDDLCRKFGKKFSDLCCVLNFPTTKDEDKNNENRFKAYGINKDKDKWIAYRHNPTTEAVVKKGPFSTKQEAIKASDMILKSFPNFDSRELNDISEIKIDLEAQHEKAKADLIQSFEEKLKEEQEGWKKKQKEFEATIEALEMQIAFDCKPRSKLADMLKTLHTEKQILQRRVESVKQETKEEVIRIKRQCEEKMSALEKELDKKLSKEKGWDLLS